MDSSFQGQYLSSTLPLKDSSIQGQFLPHHLIMRRSIDLFRASFDKRHTNTSPSEGCKSAVIRRRLLLIPRPNEPHLLRITTM